MEWHLCAGTFLLTVFFFWAVMPCRLIGRNQHFGVTSVSIFRAEYGYNLFLRNVSIYQRVYTASQPRKTIFRSNILSPSSGLNMETICFSEISTYESTRHHNPEEQHRHLQRRKKLKFHNVFTYTENWGMKEGEVRITCSSFVLNRLIQTVHFLCKITHTLLHYDLASLGHNQGLTLCLGWRMLWKLWFEIKLGLSMR
jgi:hypothetical protein